MLERILSWFVTITISRMIFQLFGVEFKDDDLYLITFVWAIASLSNININKGE